MKITRTLRFTAAVMLCGGIGGMSLAEPAGQASGVQALRHIPYVESGHPNQVLDIYLPERSSDEPLPLMVWIHGGAWMAGTQANPPVLFLVEKGFAVASIQYRFSSHAVWPAQAHDCKAAVRFLRANAVKYNFDPERFAVGGDSAGGHLAAFIGTSGDVSEMEGDLGHQGVSSRVQAVVDMFGPTDLAQMGKHADPDSTFDYGAPNAPESLLLGGPIKEKLELAKTANPLTYIDKNDPPFLIMHGDNDRLVPLGQSLILANALMEAGVGEVTMKILHGAGHGGPPFFDNDSRRLIVDFLVRNTQTTEGISVLSEGPKQMTPDWTNPIVPQRADPHVLLHDDGYYYMAATVPSYDRVELRRARTIGGLASAEAKVVWTRPSDGPLGGLIWAPEIHFIDGKWYVYVSAGEGGKPWDSIRPHALVCTGDDPLNDEWKVAGRIMTKWDTFSLDATTFEHNGHRYFVWCQVEPDILGTNIMIAKMKSPTELEDKQVILSRPEYEWEQQVYWVNEAPAALVRNNRVFITYSASATDANYCMGLLTANADADLLDPKSWSKSKEPVFKSSDATSQYGPGHNSFTTTPDGQTVIMFYHARNYKEIQGGSLANPDRHTRAQIVNWQQDGMPDFGVPVPDGTYYLSKHKLN